MRGAAVLLIVLGACGHGGDQRRGDGGTCGGDSECESGLCLESTCLDGADDDDEDGLSNDVEGRLGTGAFAYDSDGDGANDRDEVGDIDAPRDFDGDGANDAVESDSRDRDGDCLADQRDPEDTVAEDDLGKLADLGCCCSGRCSLAGSAPSATCVDGRLGCSIEEADRDDDGIADPCDMPSLVLDSAVVDAGCTQACTRIAACPGAAVTLADCEDECVNRARHEGLWLANYYCHAAGCNAEVCFGEALRSVELLDWCGDACDRAEGCGLFAVGDAALAGTCDVACAGNFFGRGPPEVWSCLGELPESGCRAVDALSCQFSAALCQDACSHVGDGDGVGDRPLCRAGSPVYRSYERPGDCLSACGADDSSFGRVAFLACSLAIGCSDPGSRCVSAPDPAPAGCVSVCAALAPMCAGDPLAEASICQAFCSGLAQAVPDPDFAAARVCVESADECPAADGGGPAGLLLRCIAGIDERCSSTCDRFTECVGGDGAGCEQGCTGLVISHPERITPTFACLEQTPECADIAACAPADPNLVCVPACDHVVGCDATYPGGVAQCRNACVAEIGSNLDRYASWRCLATSAACDDRCDALEEVAAPAECVSACASSELRDTCIEAAYGICEGACQGALTGLGLENQSAAECVLRELGRRCAPTGLEKCVAP